jgi:hypothetical protein
MYYLGKSPPIIRENKKNNPISQLFEIKMVKNDKIILNKNHVRFSLQISPVIFLPAWVGMYPVDIGLVLTEKRENQEYSDSSIHWDFMD